jgi:DNA-binding MarR family transcriptional regulator
MNGTRHAHATARAQPDIETRISSDDHRALRLWLRMLATTNLIEARVRRLLHDRFDQTLPRFDFMAQLARVPEGLKMGDLSQRMMVTGGNVTGIADLLEKQKLIVRVGDPDDRRASRVRLTPAGRKAFRAMAETHERWIVDALRTLTPAELSTMSEMLGRVKTHVRTAEGSRK